MAEVEKFMKMDRIYRTTSAFSHYNVDIDPQPPDTEQNWELKSTNVITKDGRFIFIWTWFYYI